MGVLATELLRHGRAQRNSPVRTYGMRLLFVWTRSGKRHAERGELRSSSAVLRAPKPMLARDPEASC